MLDGSYSISDIQDYFEYVLKKHGKKTFNTSIRTYISKIENRVTFKIKRGYYHDAMKLLGSTKSEIRKDEIGENVPYLEVTKVVLIHCNIVNNSYQQASRVLCTFVPNKLSDQLLNISPKNFIF